MKRYSMLLSILLVMAILITTLSILPGAQPEAYSLAPQAVKTITANPGSTIKFTGDGAPNSNVNRQISTSTSVDVKKGRYSISLNNVYIPGSSNGFSITASNVQSMTVAGNSLASKGISAAKEIIVSDGSGSFSVSNVPSDKYHIMVYGSASGSSVNIHATASCRIPVDSSGKYIGTVNTQGMPAGIYHVTQGGTEVATVYLGVPVQ
jgi:hypothetical protein